MSNIKVTDFMSRFRDKQIDVARARRASSMSGIDIQSADYNGDGVISGEIELRRLFTEVDEVDSDGNPHTVNADRAKNAYATLGTVATPRTTRTVPAPSATVAEQGEKMGEGGATSAQDTKKAHEDAIAATGIGTHYGDHSSYKSMDAAGRRRFIENNKLPGTTPSRPKESSCIGWAMEHVGAAYKAAGKEARWNAIKSKVLRNGAKGTDLAKELKADGWTSVYFNPDALDAGSGGSEAEHEASARAVMGGGKYYGIKVDDMIVDYRPSSGSKTIKDTTGIDALKDAPFFFGVARGGDHTFVGYGDTVSEFHWDANPDSTTAIEERSLENFPWQSGLLMIPPGTWTR